MTDYTPPPPLFRGTVQNRPTKANQRAGIAAMVRDKFRPTDPNVRPADKDRLTGQNAEVLAALQAGVRIGAAWADEHGVRRLAARVRDLRERGHVIRSERDPETNCEVYFL